MSAVWGWSKVECTSDGGAPCQRSLHAAAVLNDSIFIFGGEWGSLWDCGLVNLGACCCCCC
ncbi:unnamed protein product [Laminaria digitata]